MRSGYGHAGFTNTHPIPHRATRGAQRNVLDPYTWLPAASDATLPVHNRGFAGGVGVFGSVGVRISLCVGIVAMLAGGTPSALAARFPSVGRTVVGATKPPRYTIVSSDLTAPQSDFNTMGTASCPAGTATWGGGMYFASYQVPGSSINSTFWNDSSPGSWVVRVNNSGTNSDSVSISAICAKKPSKYQLVSTTVDDPSGAQTSGVATCPAKTVILSGGVASTADQASVYLTSAYPTSKRTFQAYQYNGSSNDQPFYVYALCAAKPPGYKRTSASSTAPAGEQGAAVADCPANTSVIGGGIGTGAPNAAVIPNASNPTPSEDGQPSQWLAISSNSLDAAVTVTAYAICAN